MDKLTTLIKLTEQLAPEQQALALAQTVHDSAYVLLVRHLATQGLVKPVLLVGDLLTMGRAQSGAAWRDGHAGLANAVRVAHGLTAAQPPARRRGAV